MASSTRDKMQQAHTLIKSEKYDEARAILETVNHPKAFEWLNKLDKVAPTLDDPFVPTQNRTVNIVLGMVSLITGVAGIIVLIGLVFFASQYSAPSYQAYLIDPQKYNDEFRNTVLPLALVVLILLPVSYLTRKLRR